MTLLPDDTGTASSDWIAVGESTRHEALASDDDGTSYVKCDDNDEKMIIEFANPSVVEADIDTIDSVRFLSSGKSAHRSNVTRCSFKYYVPSGNADQNAIYPAHRTDFTTINGTPRTTSDGSSAAWTYANLEDLQMRCTLASTVEAYLSYFAVEVTYTEAVTANATFFGANF